MSWNTDKEPLEYLEQRVRYYEKKVRLMNRMVKDHNIIKRFGIDKVMNASERYYLRSKQFKEAIKKLKA